MAERLVKIYPPFERFWHWGQVILVLVMTFTGFRLYGLHEWIPYEQAVVVHTYAALLLMLLWVFAIFWHFTTGTWKHYVPTSDGLFQVIRFYSFGIFKGEKHPYRKAYWRKHNPLQAMANRVHAHRGLIVPIGFVSDHMEVVWDLDHEARDHATELGMTLTRAETVGTHPAFVSMIREANSSSSEALS